MSRRLAARGSVFLSLVITASVLAGPGFAADPPPDGSPAASPSAAPGASPGSDQPLVADAPLVSASLTDVVPFQATGWKYQQVGFDGLAGFQAPGFDDSGWPSGPAPFRSGGGCSVQSTTPFTSWSTNTDLLVRRHIALTPGTNGVEVSIVVDNDAIGVFWNGTQIGGPLTHENCPFYSQPMTFTVSPTLVTADNVLAIRARDRGAESFLDVRVVTGAMPSEPITDATEKLENGASGGDPVQTFSGAFLYGFTDVAITGRGPALAFSRSYNSLDTRAGPLGPGWTHSLNTRLRHATDVPADILLVGPDGNTDRFTANADETFSPSPATYRTLVRNADGTYTVTDKARSRWLFDGAGNLTSIVDRHGNASTLAYDAAGQLVSIADPAGRGSLTLGYTNGLLTSVTDWAVPARTVTYQYDAQGRLWKVTDREGKTTTFAYDATSNRISSITDARGHVALTLTYDAGGRVATQKDAKGIVTGATTTFGYVVNPDGTRVTTVTSPPTSFEPSFSPTLVDTYTPQGWLTGRVVRPSSTETLTESYAYDAIGNRASVTDARGNTTTMCYDVNTAGSAIAGSRGNLTRRIDPSPTAGAARPVTLIGYDGLDNPIQTVSPRGVASSSTTNCATDLTGAVNTQYATDLAYDATGARLLSTTSRSTDPELGAQTAVTKLEYADAANPGLVTRIVPPRGNTTPTPDYTYATSYTYFGSGSQAGLLAGVADALGNTTTYTYDAVGRPVGVVDPLGNAAGGVPADHRTDYVYDNEDRVRFVRLPAPSPGGAQLVTETRYDEVGNPVVRIDANGQVTTYTYDGRDGLFQVNESPTAWTDPAVPPAAVITTEYAYDAAGNLTRMIRATGDAAAERVTDYAYDGRGLVRRETQYPDWPTTSPTLVTTSTYDAGGNIATVVDALGRTTTYAYDALNRLVSIDYSDAGTPDVSYAYDANGNRISMIDGSGASSYTYDETDRLLSVTSPGPKTVGYRYDLDGNRTKLIYPDATAVTYSFDKASRMSSLTDWAARSVAYTYFPDSALKEATNPNGTVATRAYDNARRASDILHKFGATTVGHYAYTLDALGNVVSLQDGDPALSRVSASNANAQGNGASGGPSISADGRYVAFSSSATNLVPNDSNAVADIFVRDLQTGTTTRVSVATDGTEATSSSSAPAISAGGRYVAFTSAATNLVAGDTNAVTDIFIRDLQTGTTTRVSVATDGTEATGASGEPSISADGRYVAFESTDTTIAFGDTNGASDVFLHDLLAGGNRWISRVSDDTQANAGSFSPSVTANGSVVAFASDATNLVSDDSNGLTDVFTKRTSTLQQSAYGYDRLYRLTSVAGPDGPRTYAYDPLGNRTSLGAGGTTTYDYDRADRILSLQGPPAAASSTRPPSANDAGWTSSANAYTSDNTYATSSPSKNTTTTVKLGTFGFDSTIPADATITGVTVTVEWKVSTTASNATLGAQAWVSGAAYGTELVDATEPTSDLTQSFTVTGLTRAQLLNGVFQVRIRATRGTSNTAFTASLDAVSVRVNYTTPDNRTITVNAAGAMTARGADTFAYDQPNRLTSATVAGWSETYTYDGDGVRFSRQVGASPASRYVSDVAAGLPVTLDDGARKYVWGLGLAYAVSATGLEVYHADRLGSVRAITDGTGAVIATYRTDEWGVATASSGSSTQPFAYTGEPRDATGLSYLRARYYDPSLGRFMSRDTWAGFGTLPTSLNRYGYVGDNPTTYRDPSGRIGPVVCVLPWVAPICVGLAVDTATSVWALLLGAAALVTQLHGDTVPPVPPATGTLQEPRPKPAPYIPPSQPGPVCSGNVCRIVVVTGAGLVTIGWYYIRASGGVPFRPEPGPPALPPGKRPR